MIYLISTVVFCGVIMVLVGLLLLVEAKVVKKGDNRIVINTDDTKAIHAPSGSTLLSALTSNRILIPSACGGKGTCGTCKCQVPEGGGDILPTELGHLSRRERSEQVRLACQLKVRQDMQIRIPEEFFNIKKYQAVVVSNQNVATFIKELVLQLEGGQRLDFKAGAYIQIDIPEYEAAFETFQIEDVYRSAWDQFNLWQLKAANVDPVFRAYSLANPPAEGDVLKFTIRIATPPPGAAAPPGIGSSYVFQLMPGDRVSLSGPYGDFFVKETQREMCFIGGGAGMAPMRSHILHQLEGEGTQRRLTFWYGARSRQEMFYDGEFRALAAEHPNFTYHVALSEPQPEDNWDGLVGFIHQCLLDTYLEDHDDPTEIEYYLCGPPPMIDAVNHMLYDLGVEQEMIAYDKFG
ncbi:MAG: NADH:ubiquinone reductase (Na(+)-transporting) subunit F [Desulfosarcinaceae bacterium]|nr:NADH:ubiquinone reductase (Na(+)-transporting) subunit F [Desulfosarcinaceae bacterium]